MKVLLVLAAALLITINALPSRDRVLEQWEQFKVVHARSYDNKEEALRKEIFRKNLESIEEHNARFAKGLETYQQGINHFSDQTEDELQAYTGGLILPTATLEEAPLSIVVAAPDSLDLRAALGPIKNQGTCGSCWAFATTASIEAAYSIQRNQTVSLSEQQLVDCVKTVLGCKGGIMDSAYTYIKQNGGIETEGDYPYLMRDGHACSYTATKTHLTVSGFVGVKSGSEDALLNAIATVGPVAVAIDATANFQKYKSGVFSDVSCSAAKLNHAVTLVGYGTENGQDYWLIRNSWGTVWGEAGHGKIARNKSNQCGISTHATYPTLDDQ